MRIPEEMSAELGCRKGGSATPQEHRIAASGNPATSVHFGIICPASRKVVALRLKGNGLSKNELRRNGPSGFGMSPEDVRTLRTLKTPMQIQKFIDALEYQYADTAWSPQRVLRERKGHCMEGALLAAAALRVNGQLPLLMDLEGVRDDDHVVALYREHGLWGGVAKSNFAGLRFRAPVYRSIRELAMSYFEHYYNLRGERTMRGYSLPVNLARVDKLHWMTSEEDVWCVPELLIAARHYPLFPDKVGRALPRLDRRSFEAGMHGWVKH
jgi:hypothetical protein